MHVHHGAHPQAIAELWIQLGVPGLQLTPEKWGRVSAVWVLEWGGGGCSIQQAACLPAWDAWGREARWAGRHAGSQAVGTCRLN